MLVDVESGNGGLADGHTRTCNFVAARSFFNITDLQTYAGNGGTIQRTIRVSNMRQYQHDTPRLQQCGPVLICKKRVWLAGIHPDCKKVNIAP